MTQGVITDPISKFMEHPSELEVYGYGTQTMLYIYIDDLVDGMMSMLNHTNEKLNAYLVGIKSTVTVAHIAQIVMDENVFTFLLYALVNIQDAKEMFISIVIMLQGYICVGGFQSIQQQKL